MAHNAWGYDGVHKFCQSIFDIQQSSSVSANCLPFHQHLVSRLDGTDNYEATDTNITGKLATCTSIAFT